MDHLYIRHTVGGRLFLDSKQHELPFSITTAEGREGWKIRIREVDESIAGPLCRHHDELNIFVVADGAVDRKTWYYSTHGLVDYDAAARELVIWADGKIDYSV
ncbi:hypothetical protein [Paenibacillus montanisoli]|uniref:Uncharacterized protein n=1 Tax=Paenibacillus montanisoli TaxID=2081970 RepID=A0A328TWA8_9BACL|nr:hypothetical protein [Paenibacillus montanisoli]RAP74630.1 hypothetical protein DL346_21490 [Paenibacillus montanisoli]